MMGARRSAHAATAPKDQEDENQAGPSNYYRRSDPTSSSGKGNGGSSRVSGEGIGDGRRNNEYRFPKKGGKGGEPDPFEVMALDRTASQSDVKKQCTSKFQLAIHMI